MTRGPLPIAQALAYTHEILEALRFAHRHGIIHRDIKPHNILIGERLKVTDFGIARAGASQMTEAGSIMGTAQYLSPEQARGAPGDGVLRPLLGRNRPLRDADREGALHRRLGDRDRDEAPERPAQAALQDPPGDPGGAGRGRPARTREEPRGPLPDRRGVLGGPAPGRGGASARAGDIGGGHGPPGRSGAHGGRRFHGGARGHCRHDTGRPAPADHAEAAAALRARLLRRASEEAAPLGSVASGPAPPGRGRNRRLVRLLADPGPARRQRARRRAERRRPEGRGGGDPHPERGARARRPARGQRRRRERPGVRPEPEPRQPGSRKATG